VEELAIIVALMFMAASLAIYAIYWTIVFNGRERQIIKRRLDVSRRLDNPSVDLEACEESAAFAIRPTLFYGNSVIGWRKPEFASKTRLLFWYLSRCVWH